MTSPFNTIGIICGARGTGKTPLIMGGEEEQGVAKIYIQKGMSVLILDTLDHPKYRSVRTILPKDFSKLSKTAGIYRCLASAYEMPKVIDKLKSVWNTAIIFEDCYKYIKKSLSKSDLAVIADSKQQNNDLLYMFACWAFIPPDLCRTCDYYVIFKTSDSPEYRYTELGGCFNEAMKAHSTVKSGKKRYVVVSSGI
jgi:hypothetical protein